MKVLILTSGIGNQDGWARYSQGLSGGLAAKGVECVVAEGVFPLAQARRADRIHAFVETYAVRAFWLSLIARKPYVVTVHGTFGLTTPLYALRHAAQVVCVSRYTENL